MTNIALIAARGGSKGIPKKNLANISGLPLIAWSILKAKSSNAIDSVWVTSDDQQILTVSSEYGAKTILRPIELATDQISSEDAWIHALNEIHKQTEDVGLVFALQATSPVRDSWDFDEAHTLFVENKYDSLLSVNRVEDHFMWTFDNSNCAIPINYDYKNRKRRQEIAATYIENGSFYIFKPDRFMREKNRLFGKIGLYEMQMHKMFQIDKEEDIVFCEALLRYYNKNL